MTEILCRVHNATRTPVIFVAGTVDYDKRTVQSWIKGEPQTVSLNYYAETGPLSEADEEVLRKRYANHFNDPEVRVRHRLPRTTPVRENILAKPGRKPAGEALTSVEKANLKAVEPTPAPVAPEQNKRATDVQAAPVAPATPSPQQIWEAIEQHRIETVNQINAAIERLSALQPTNRAGRRAAPKKPAHKPAVKSASRKSAAKRIPTKV